VPAVSDCAPQLATMFVGGDRVRGIHQGRHRATLLVLQDCTSWWIEPLIGWLPIPHAPRGFCARCARAIRLHGRGVVIGHVDRGPHVFRQGHRS
jgi:hypothetical protein